MNEAEIRALARMLDRMDYYRLLKVDRDAAPPTIRSAYHAMRRGFHPDAYHEQEPELVAAVSQISKRINEGYQVLRNPGRRKAYDQALQEGGELRFSAKHEEAQRQEVEARDGRTANGKRFWADAQRAEKSGDLAAALKAVKMALTFEPDNPHFKQKREELDAKVPAKPKGGGSNPFSIR